MPLVRKAECFATWIELPEDVGGVLIRRGDDVLHVDDDGYQSGEGAPLPVIERAWYELKRHRSFAEEREAGLTAGASLVARNAQTVVYRAACGTEVEFERKQFIAIVRALRTLPETRDLNFLAYAIAG